MNGKRLRAFWDTIINIARCTLVVLWILFCIVYSLLLRFITRNDEAPRTLVRTFFSPVILRILGAKLFIQGRENITPSESYIFASNHSSLIDIPCIYIALERSLYFLAKDELKKAPFLGWYIGKIGTIFIDRENPMKAAVNLKDLIKLIRSGKSIVGFPEGTRSVSGEIQDFKEGLFVIAMSSRAPIVPVAVKGSDQILPAKSFNIRPGNIYISIGRPIAVQGKTENDLRLLSKKIREEIISLHESMKS